MDEALITEALRRGLIDEGEARRQLGIVEAVKKEEPGLVEQAVGHGKAALTGLANAATGFVGLPGEVQELLGRAMPQHPGLMTPKLWTREDVKGVIGEQTGMSLYKPQTMGEQYTAAGTEGAASLFNPFNPAKLSIPILGAAGGMAGEALSQGMPGNKFARLAGDTPFQAIALAMMAKKPQAAKMMSDWMKETGEVKLAAGGDRAAAAGNTLGTDVYLPQAMPDTPIMGALFEAAKAHPKGTQLTEGLGAQREAATSGPFDLVQNLSPGTFEQKNIDKIVARGQKLGGSIQEQVFPMEGTSTFKNVTRNLDKLDAKDVRKAAANMNYQNTEDFPLLVKKTLMDKWEAAQSTTPFDVAKTWRGPMGSQQRARFDVYIEEAAKSNGLDPQEARMAANELLDAVETASHGQGGGKPAVEAGGTFVSGLLKSVGINAPFHQLGYALDKKAANKVIEGFIEAMTSADPTRKMIELSHFSNLGHKTKAVTRALMSTGVQQQDR